MPEERDEAHVEQHGDGDVNVVVEEQESNGDEQQDDSSGDE